MSRISALAALAAAALATVFLAASPASGITGPQTFSLLEVEGQDIPLDPGVSEDGPPRQGARIAFTSSLYRWAGTKRGARAGSLEGFCTFIRVDLAAESATAYCTVAWRLPAGQILGAGFIRFAADSGPVFRIAVIGGTGTYHNARGVVEIRDIGGDESGKSSHLFKLVP